MSRDRFDTFGDISRHLNGRLSRSNGHERETIGISRWLAPGLSRWPENTTTTFTFTFADSIQVWALQTLERVGPRVSPRVSSLVSAVCSLQLAPVAPSGLELQSLGAPRGDNGRDAIGRAIWPFNLASVPLDETIRCEPLLALFALAQLTRGQITPTQSAHKVPPRVGMEASGLS